MTAAEINKALKENEQLSERSAEFFYNREWHPALGGSYRDERDYWFKFAEEYALWYLKPAAAEIHMLERQIEDLRNTVKTLSEFIEEGTKKAGLL